jgi:hypothetical protein
MASFCARIFDDELVPHDSIPRMNFCPFRERTCFSSGPVIESAGKNTVICDVKALVEATAISGPE